AIAAGVIALLLALALAFLLPLKTVEPYVVTVDRQTGAVEVASSLASGQISQNEAVIQSHLANYVVARESFDQTDLAEQYRRVQLMSAPAASRAYVASMAATNPESPLRTLSKGDTVSVKVKSVSITGPGTALVRFEATRGITGETNFGPTNFVAAISFGFSNRPLRTADRYDNPLGFQVTRYRRDVEGFAG
ncbi:MAG: VirB8/TrbF family protein, partial [Pseudomonadota bacterium]|nr:VirB8/TrbF family protein [Pseudomonadota bacterium]